VISHSLHFSDPLELPLACTRFYGDSFVKPSGWSTLMDFWSRELELDLAGAFNGIKEEV
jgi:hypothetical protein